MDVEVRLNLGPQNLTAELSPDGYCYDQQAMLQLIRRASEHHPESPRPWKLLERLQKHGRLGLSDLCALASLGPEQADPPVSHLLRGLLGAVLLWPALPLGPARRLLVDCGRLAVSPQRFAQGQRQRWPAYLRDLYRFVFCADLGRAQAALATATLTLYVVSATLALHVRVQEVLVR